MPPLTRVDLTLIFTKLASKLDLFCNSKPINDFFEESNRPIRAIDQANQYLKLESVAIANALQLEAARHRAQSLSALISWHVPSLKSLNLSFAVFAAFFLLIRYVML